MLATVALPAYLMLTHTTYYIKHRSLIVASVRIASCITVLVHSFVHPGEFEVRAAAEDGSGGCRLRVLETDEAWRSRLSAQATAWEAAGWGAASALHCRWCLARWPMFQCWCRCMPRVPAGQPGPLPSTPTRLTTMPTATSACAHTLAPSPAELYSDSLLKALCGKCVLSMALNTFRNRLRFTSHLMSQVGAPAQTDRSLEDERGGLLWVPVRLAGVLGQWKLEGPRIAWKVYIWCAGHAYYVLVMHTA